MVFVSPFATTDSTPGAATSASESRCGSREEATMSRSPTVSFQRRVEPASSIRSAAPVARSNRTSSPPISRASERRTRAAAVRIRWMPSRIFFSVFSPNPFTSRTRPSRQAASSSVTLPMESAAWSAAIFFGPRSGMRSISPIPAGSSERIRSRRGSRPVRASSSIFSASALPIPGRSVRVPAAMTSSSPPGSSSRARAPFS